MATNGSADRPGGASSASPADPSAPGARLRSRSRARSRPETKNSAKAQSGRSSPCRHLASPTRDHSCISERFQRWSGAWRSSGGISRRDGTFVCPGVALRSMDVSTSIKHRVLDEREIFGRRKSDAFRHEEEQAPQSNSENEEPLAWRTRNKSAFVRNPNTVSGASQRSRSCTDQEEHRRRKLKGAPLSAVKNEVSLDHSATAGILLSAENRRCTSAPVTGPDRLLAWRAMMTSTTTPLGLLQPERSISPDSNDSISEELNHFKPIVCSPCTPPKRLPDGRLLEPTIVKSTPRNLSRGLQKATSYEASPAVLQKWRQIELDRQNLKVDCKSTLTSPVMEIHEDEPKTLLSSVVRARNVLVPNNKRKLDFEAGNVEEVTGHLVKIRVPAIRYNKQVVTESTDLEIAGSPELYAGGTLFGPDRTYSPFTRNSSFRLCRLEASETNRNHDLQLRSSSGRKSQQKTRHLDAQRDLDRLDDRLLLRRIQQERQDRSLALQLQRQFDQEEGHTALRPTQGSYFLRSWKSNPGRRRRGLRRSRPGNKKL